MEKKIKQCQDLFLLKVSITSKKRDNNNQVDRPQMFTKMLIYLFQLFTCFNRDQILKCQKLTKITKSNKDVAL